MGLLQRIFGKKRKHPETSIAIPRPSTAETEIRRFVSLQDANEYAAKGGWEMISFFLKEETVKFDKERIKSYVYYVLLRKA